MRAGNLLSPARAIDMRRSISSPRGEKPMHSASSADGNAFRLQDPAMAAETSSSSREINRGLISTMVTWLPKRRYIWPNSRPM